MATIDYKNIDPTQAQDAVDNASRNLRRMLYFRRQHDARRLMFYRQYIGNRDQQYFPDGVTKRSNIFVMYPYSNVETVVSRTMDALFGYDPWFQCNPRGANDAPANDKMQTVLGYKLRKARVPDAIESLTRTIGIYGHGGVKVDWDWGFDMVTQKVPVLAHVKNTDPETGQEVQIPITTETGQPIPVRYESREVPVPRSCPRITPIDVFDLLVDPDSGMTAHVVERSFGEMKRENIGYAQKNEGAFLYLPETLDEIERRLQGQEDKDSTIIRFAEFWNTMDDTCTILTFGEDREALGWKDRRTAFRVGTSYSTYKRKVYTGPNLLLYVGKNQFNHKRSPILHTSYVKLPNEVYGLGVIESTIDMTEGLNSTVNMIKDNWNLGVNRRYAYNMDIDMDHTSLNEANVPGGKVGVAGDPRAAIMELPTHTPTQGDYAIVDLFKNMLEMSSGISDFYSRGVGTPAGNGTASGIASVISESNYRFKMFIRNLELDILQPMLEMCCSMIQQFMSDEEEVELTDENPAIPKFMSVSPSELIGSFSFTLLAANYAANETVRQRNLMAFANIAGPSGYINEYEGLKALGKAMKIPEINQILKSPEQFQQEQMQMQEAQRAADQAAFNQEVALLVLKSELQAEVGKEIAEAKGASTPSSPSTSKGGKEGRPRKSQFEGKIPGAGTSSPMKDLAQNLIGPNGLGLQGIGEGGTS